MEEIVSPAFKAALRAYSAACTQFVQVKNECKQVPGCMKAVDKMEEDIEAAEEAAWKAASKAAEASKASVESKMDFDAFDRRVGEIMQERLTALSSEEDADAAAAMRRYQVMYHALTELQCLWQAADAPRTQSTPDADASHYQKVQRALSALVASYF